MDKPTKIMRICSGCTMEGWKAVSLEEIVELRNGERPFPDAKGKIPIYGANGIMGYSCNSKIDNDYTLVIGRVGASGEIHIAKGEIWVSDNAIYTANYKKQDVFLPFLYFLLLFRDLRQYSTKTTHPIITQSFLKSFKIALPPLVEQRKIAEILSTVDQAIQKIREAIEKTQKLKKGLMQELLTKGIGHKEFKITEIGTIPIRWEVAKLSQVGKIVTGTTPSTNVDMFWGEGFPFVTPSDFSSNKYVIKTERKVTEYGVKKAKIIPKDAIMVSCIGSIGEVAMSSAESLTNQQINSIICDKEINAHYIYYAMNFSKRRLKRWAGITTNPIVKKSLFEFFPIPLPPLPEQQKIADILSSVDKRIEILRKRKERLEKLKKGLMEDLLTGSVRVIPLIEKEA